MLTATVVFFVFLVVVGVERIVAFSWLQGSS
jgi:hypothetical protein